MASAVRFSAEGKHRVFADTSYFFALLHPRDPHHADAVEISEKIARERLTVYTTWEVVVETATLLRYRANFELARMFLLDVLPDLVVIYPLEAEREAHTLRLWSPVLIPGLLQTAVYARALFLAAGAEEDTAEQMVVARLER